MCACEHRRKTQPQLYLSSAEPTFVAFHCWYVVETPYILLCPT
ncbi:hypothetical protein NC652_035710 [Populus alba x Populus x berolinensis]|nr:hypothetical protein NC652_035710 [Populus alba x Populus x berolinensis]